MSCHSKGLTIIYATLGALAVYLGSFVFFYFDMRYFDMHFWLLLPDPVREILVAAYFPVIFLFERLGLLPG